MGRGPGTGDRLVSTVPQENPPGKTTFNSCDIGLGRILPCMISVCLGDGRCV